MDAPLLPALGSAMLVHGESGAVQGLADGLLTAGLAGPWIHAPALDQAFDIVFRDDRWQTEPALAAATPRLAPAKVRAARDWHNDYAAALLDLRAALQQENDDHQREQLLNEVRRLIGSHRAGVGNGSKHGTTTSSQA